MTIFIGVDPAYRKNGFYICSINNKTVSFSRMSSFIDYVRFIDDLKASNVDCIVCIENSNETNHTFVGKTVTGKQAREKISRDVGKNQAVSQMAVDYAKHRLDYNVYSVSPAMKGIKINDKIMRASLNVLGLSAENYKGLVSEQDKRDAYKLAVLAKDMLTFHKIGKNTSITPKKS